MVWGWHSCVGELLWCCFSGKVHDLCPAGTSCCCLCSYPGVKSELTQTAAQLEAERALSQELKQQLEAIKSEYITAGVVDARQGIRGT